MPWYRAGRHRARRRLLEDVADRLRRSGYVVGARAPLAAAVSDLYACREGVQIAILVALRGAASLDDLSRRVALSDWAAGGEQREFVLLRAA